MRATTNPNVLDIDIKGYRQTLQNKGKPRILIEGLSNAFDTKSSIVVVTFSQENGWATLTVEDNDPDGFKSLKDAWTLFAASERREDLEARGRFGQGEKELIAIAVDGGELMITSTTGTASFTKEGRKLERTRTPLGTQLYARLKLNQAEAREFEALVQSIIVPQDVTFKFNDTHITRPVPVKVMRETLDTVYWDEEGQIHETRRMTDVELFEANGSAYIYELGIPVVEHDGRFSINVQQKVPLNSARDNVKPAYLRKLRQVTLDATFDILSPDDHKTAWVKDALPIASDEAFKANMHQIYGANAVIFDVNNPESNKRATDQGRTVITGPQHTKEEWKRVREVFQPAGKAIPVGVGSSPDGVPPIPRALWTEGMHNLERYVHEIGLEILNFMPDVEFFNANITGTEGRRAPAWWGGGTISFNLRVLGKAWPGEASQEDVDYYIVHEFTHHRADDHFTDAFIREIGRIGAKLRSCKARLR